ncbi:MAG: hypothetical protein LBP53_05235 [Candidatus Peribacteria bacterium]|jgi:hypothetical protein|nr:hypothetical protein [Candidatus Peribacteria bacterium]
MKDNPTKNFPKYNNIINVAHNSGYTIEAHFVFDGGEARYRNAVIRDRTVALESYLDYRSGYQTIDYLANDPKVLKVEIRDNSVNNTNAVPSKQKIIYEN